MKNTSRDETKKKAPDGGWGWFVCLGSSLISLSLRSLDPSFGLLFQDLLDELNIKSTGTSVIMSVLDAIVNFSGLFVGPLLKKYSYRKVAFFGSLLSCIGLMLTSRADSMPYLICTYSILGGFGTGIAIASAFVALNTFFDKKRGQAVGFSMAGTTLAMMLVPQLVHILLKSYGFRGTMMIISAWALHSVVGACLLRSLETKKKETSISKKTTEPKEKDALLQKTSTSLRKITNGTSHDNEDGRRRSETRVVADSKIIEIEDDDNKKKSTTTTTFFNKIMKTFDLDLLNDTVYLNVVIGTSLYYVAESNFKLMTPFFLSSIGMTKSEVAFCLSITAFTDILARLTLPTIFDRLGLRKRSIFWICSIMVGFGRSVLAERTKGTTLIVLFVIIGFLRGATLVNLNLSISECCSLKKLPSAFGIFMVCKGIFVVAMSPLIGYIRDYTQSYRICIHVMTSLIILTFISWTIEFSYFGIRKRKPEFIEETQKNTIE